MALLWPRRNFCWMSWKESSARGKIFPSSLPDRKQKGSKTRNNRKKISSEHLTECCKTNIQLLHQHSWQHKISHAKEQWLALAVSHPLKTESRWYKTPMQNTEKSHQEEISRGYHKKSLYLFYLFFNSSPKNLQPPSGQCTCLHALLRKPHNWKHITIIARCLCTILFWCLLSFQFW